MHSLIIIKIQDGLQVDYSLQLNEKAWLTVGVIICGIVFVIACIKISINSIYISQMIVKA